MRTLVSFVVSLAVGASSFLGFAHMHPHASAVAAPAGAALVRSASPIVVHPIYLSFDMDMNGFMYRKSRRTGRIWYDPALFAYLEQHHIPATFFVSGLFASTYPDLLRSLASTSQFAFENHSYDESSFTPHCYWLRTLTTNTQKTQQIQETEQLIKRYTGQTATYFRFPGDCTNAENDAFVRKLGYVVNDGTDIAGDPFNRNMRAIVHAVLSDATTSATILMHIGGPNAPESLVALKQIMPALSAEGYRFERL